MVKLTFCNPSRKLIEAVRKILDVSGVEVKTEEFSGVQCLVLEVSGIHNDEFEWTIGRELDKGPRYTKQDLIRIIEAIRWIDPILSEFKAKCDRNPPDEYFVHLSSVVDGSCNDAGEITLEIGSRQQPGSKGEIEFTFIEELIHHLQFECGGEPYYDVTEDKERMIELAYRCIPNSWIPKIYEELRERFKP